jgi:hypothetical protein
MLSIKFISEGDDTEKAISESLDVQYIWDIVASCGDGDDGKSKNWTEAINKTMYEVAKRINKNYLVASKLNSLRDNPEWLYDLVWYSDNKFGIDKIHLILESEWKTPKRHRQEEYDYFYDLKYDFEKLIMGRSEHRVFIFEGDTKEEIESIFDKLIAIIKASKIPLIDDRFMFAGWITSKEFYFDIYIHK